jgi:hypothetical protein
MWITCGNPVKTLWETASSVELCLFAMFSTAYTQDFHGLSSIAIVFIQETKGRQGIVVPDSLGLQSNYTYFNVEKGHIPGLIFFSKTLTSNTVSPFLDAQFLTFL